MSGRDKFEWKEGDFILRDPRPDELEPDQDAPAPEDKPADA